MWVRRLALVLVVLAVASGCATVKYDARSLDSEVSLGDSSRPYRVVSSFTVDDKAGWVLGLVPVNKPGGDDHEYLAALLAEEIRKANGDAAINVTLRSQSQPIDIIAGILTMGVYVLRTTTVTGDVIAYE